MRKIIISMVLLCCCLTIGAQRFYNLTALEVKIDSVLPVVTYAIPLYDNYNDSTYTVSIEYPEFIPMSDADVRHYHAITKEPLPRLPKVTQQICVSRKKGVLEVSLVPLVYRNKKYQKLVSFMLKVKSKPVSGRKALQRAPESSRYADHSILQEGTWVKIRIPKTGIYQLSSDLLQKAGFSNNSKVKIYGYGGGLQPEKLTPEYLTETDDLKEVPTCTVGSRRLFHAVGPVTWNEKHQRIRNPYSDYGYYFLTESDGEPLSVSQEEFLATYYPLEDDYNTLYEVDDYAWFQGGRNLYDAISIANGSYRDYTLKSSGHSTTGSVTVVVSADQATSVSVSVNDKTVGSLSVAACGSYDAMRTATKTFPVDNLEASNKIRIQSANSGSIVRLDYISIYSENPFTASDLASGSFPVPEYVGMIANQDHHADEAVDMVIVIPASGKLALQAERIKTLHETKDGLRVIIISADELYNEFSSGTPEANAYRRYLKMLYDRAETEEDMPKYLLLMGDGAWDNRMLSPGWKNEDPDDFLLCYESENSYSKTDCFVSDDYFCMLDDNEGGDLLHTDKADVAVGRFPVRTENQAAVMVDKIEQYLNNTQAGAWQNVVCVLGDDGNENQHMKDAHAVGSLVEQMHPALQVKRVMWDAYPRTTTATGNRYPDVTRLLKQQMNSGALIMNYSGHGGPSAFSHEYVLTQKDFEETVSTHLPLWVTASCDIMPFDGQEDNIGETAVLNDKGGAIAFYGTTRTVYQSYNRSMNLTFTRHLLTMKNYRATPIGEAVRLAKNELIQTGSDQTANKLQYTLLGDPALRLALPTFPVVIESINGQNIADLTEPLQIGAGSTISIAGHIENGAGQVDNTFTGEMTATVRDAAEEIVCRRNDTSEATTAFVYTDRTKTLFHGNDSVRQGLFKFSFTVPRDISYSDKTGLVTVYAVNNDKDKEANGYTDRLVFGAGSGGDDHEGPSVFCYLNSSSFVDGGTVNPTPYFIAELSDSSGINSTGNGIGHDLQLIIDGEMSRTYNLNDYFLYDFGSYTTGTVGFSIPELAEGSHHLLFRAWDVMNNSTTSELNFKVSKDIAPSFFDVECTHNPATTTTGFRIIHDRIGSNLDVILDIFDMAGRHLWQHHEHGTPYDSSYIINWDLCVDGGRRLHTGVYLYRVRISSNGSSQTSKAKKLIIISNK
ncbi:MAG: type IX secretion system sortase PorU [Prevotella sp.]|nr:type IX secretion system sortase PorU [Prevotella sp.]